MLTSVLKFAFFLAFAVSLAAITSCSPTHLEPALLASGANHLRRGSFGAYSVNPPLTKMMCALPLVAFDFDDFSYSGTEISADGRPEYLLGQMLVERHSIATQSLISVSRGMMFPLIFVCGFVAMRWAKDLGVSLRLRWAIGVLIVSDPTMIGIGSLIQNDVPAALAGMGASYLFWKWLRNGTWTNTFFTGILTGLAISTKFTWLLLYPAMIFWATVHIIVSWRVIRGESRMIITIGQILVIFLISCYTINVAYLFEGTLESLDSYDFSSSTVTACVACARECTFSFSGQLPTFMPRHFLLGLDKQLSDFEAFPLSSYLSGQWKDRGWWYYYIYGLCVKIPHVSQAVVVLGVYLFFRMTTRRYCLKVDCPGSAILFNGTFIASFALVLICAASSQDAFSVHFRYVIPSLPFLYLFGVYIFDACVINSLVKNLFCIAIVASAICTYSVCPDFVSYFNPLSGGPSNGWKHMLGSSFDWGQNMNLIKKELEARDIKIDEVDIKSYRYPYWSCIYTLAERRQSNMHSYYLVGADEITALGSPWASRLENGDGQRLTTTAWLFPVQSEGHIRKTLR